MYKCNMSHEAVENICIRENPNNVASNVYVIFVSIILDTSVLHSKPQCRLCICDEKKLGYHLLWLNVIKNTTQPN